MAKKIVAISATEELARAQVEKLLSSYESQGYVQIGNITITKTQPSIPGDVLWVKAELPITKI